MSGPLRRIQFEAAKLAKFANGATTCSLGETNVLVTVVTESSPSSAASFAPLTVDYKQKAAAAGRIPMTHIRRDVGFSEKEILTSRLIDRSIRPAFMKGFNDKTQVVCNLLAVDGHNDPDILAINGASASISISDIPWHGPVGAVRMGLIGDELVCNPTRREQEECRLNLTVAANKLGNVYMLDGTCREPVLLNDVIKSIKKGLRECINVVESIEVLQKTLGKPKKPIANTTEPSHEQMDFLSSIAKDRISQIFYDQNHDKQSRDVAIKAVQNESLEEFKVKFADDNTDVNSQFHNAFVQLIRRVYVEMLRKDAIRCDGRQFDQLRPIECQVDLYKPLHGSAIFQRGQTQVFCSTTYDSPEAAIRTDPLTLLLNGLKDKNFMLHYEFPPYATNEVGRIGSMPGRREIGHGALAERAIRPILPEKSDMTVRLNCEVLESNGSSSMASVCAGSLSLMDASADVKEHVAGVSIGLFSDEGSDTSVEPILLTDILGFEDFIGDMDFKIAGTKRAITAFQLDVKPKNGVSPTILYKALGDAHTARTKILNIMNKVIRKPREVKKDNHPVMKTIYVPPHKKAKFIGFGGVNLKKLVAQIGVRVTLLENNGQEFYSANDNTKNNEIRDNILLFAPNKDAMIEAEEFINTLLEKEYREPELDFNGIYTATIEEIRPNGVMISLYPDMQPTLLHLSQLDVRKVQHPSALDLSVGEKIQVKYFGRDPDSGQLRLSRKSLQMTSATRDHSQKPS